MHGRIYQPKVPRVPEASLTADSNAEKQQGPTWVDDDAARAPVLNCLQLVCWHADSHAEGQRGLEALVESQVQGVVYDSNPQSSGHLRHHGGGQRGPADSSRACCDENVKGQAGDDRCEVCQLELLVRCCWSCAAARLLSDRRGAAGEQHHHTRESVGPHDDDVRNDGPGKPLECESKNNRNLSVAFWAKAVTKGGIWTADWQKAHLYVA